MTLSYSSASLLSNCSMKYYHRKVLGTKADSDIEEDYSAFRIGKAVHQLMEDSLWTADFGQKEVDKMVIEYEVVDSKPYIHAMALNLAKQQQLSGLDCCFAEMEISDPETIGYIDAVMKDKKGNWWMCDLKTSARFNPDSIVPRLPNDYQLNLYASFAERVAGILELDAKKFKGAIYRVVQKSKANQKPNESYNNFLSRLCRLIKVFDVYVPLEKMNVSEVRALHSRNFKLAQDLKNGKVEPRKNLSYCDSYFKPCIYFSKCHGELSSKLKKGLTVETLQSYQENKNLIEEL